MHARLVSPTRPASVECVSTKVYQIESFDRIDILSNSKIMAADNDQTKEMVNMQDIRNLGDKRNANDNQVQDIVFDAQLDRMETRVGKDNSKVDDIQMKGIMLETQMDELENAGELHKDWDTQPNSEPCDGGRERG